MGVALSLMLGAGVLSPVVFALQTYHGLSRPAAMALAAVVALVFQPQLVVFAVGRWALGRRVSGSFLILSSACLYCGLDALLPKPFADTWGMVLHRAVWLRQVADLAGPWGLTFLIVLVNETVVWALRERPGLAALRPAKVSGLLLAGACLYGAVRYAQVTQMAGPSSRSPSRSPSRSRKVRVGLVQANLPLGLKRAAEQGDGAAAEEMLFTHLELSGHLLGRQRPPELLVWPETSYPGVYGQAYNKGQALRNTKLASWQRSRRVALIFGGYDAEQRHGKTRQFNAVVALSVPGRAAEMVSAPVGRYRKHRLFPFGETMPWLDETSWGRHWLPHVAFFAAGEGPRVLPVRLASGDRVLIGPSICYEDFFAEPFAQQARLGAELLVNVTNDGWFGPSGLVRELHLMHGVFRSIETRLPQVRAASSGVSAVIDASGEVRASSTSAAKSTLLVDVELPGRRMAQPPLAAQSLGWVMLLLAVGLSLLHRRYGAWLDPAVWEGGPRQGSAVEAPLARQHKLG